ncbi:MAG: PAS domain S-box-containing protein [Celeribacter sp.]|jgi:PAS domain S-box-containing protein
MLKVFEGLQRILQRNHVRHLFVDFKRFIVVANRVRNTFSAFGRRAYLPVWIAVIGVTIAGIFNELQDRTIQMQTARADVQNEAGLLRSQLEGYLNADIQLVKGLVAIVSTNPNLIQENFSAIAAHVIGDKEEFINIAVAPNLVVQMVHPFEANKSVLGLDYTKNDAQRAAALRVRDSGQMVLAGPITLVQGGQGIIGRFPIFVHQDGEEMFWGITSVVLDIEKIFSETGVTDPTSHIEVALIGRDGMGSDGEMFFGDASILDKNPVLMDIVLPVGAWQLAAIPIAGWPTQSDTIWQLRLILIGAGLLIIAPTFLACHLAAIRQVTIATLSRRELELKEKQVELQQLSAVAENASDSIVLTNSKSEIIWTNNAFSQMTGYTNTEARGKTPGELLNGRDTDPETVKAIIAHTSRGESFTTEILNYTRSGQKIWVDTRLVPVRDENGVVSMIVGIERDITQAKEHELELAEAKLSAEKSDRVKSEFLANMSHEIRTPMNGIIGMTDILSEMQLHKESRQCVDIIRSSSEALLNIINDILDLSRIEAGMLSLSEVDFELKPCIDAVVDVLHPIALAKGFPITVVYDENLPTIVRADDGRLRQILLNLAGNAVKFTEAGHVCIRVARHDDNPHRLIFAVEDTGIGLKKADAPQVFDRFSQADAATTRVYGGTGLGLTISRRLAEQMGGGIEVQSKVGEGSCFTVEIQTKCPKGGGEKRDTALPQDLSAIHGLRILVAEDNRTNRLLLRKFLSGFSVDLIEAVNGRLAVEDCSKYHPDIILMDMSMPELDGIAAAKAIRRLPIPQPLIIALTANAFQRDREACLEAGMDAFLSKPIKKMELLGEIVAALECELPRSNKVESKF